LRDKVHSIDWFGGAISEDEGLSHCDVKCWIRVGMMEAEGLDDR
jgi:hypothetical protein